ncbi:uncharacterized protein M421DRAFT_415044 [Didymella exigua CBS 183.55]|uniref:Uncharacterized protein n=1 Tax=Didymella exigua CBS 183.55 TaxID=1150837 RepID=A0A6A5RZZ4_9PLEO|nr:uncharacterized protein M421DRAFT_415044 [Didymella exigua CBS 183.55]KAF1933991.1 hypothetical protein M421DRAFT_415044 [Didymella exigua CBS 183.55]
MAALQQYRSLIRTPELICSDTEDLYSSEEEMPDRDETDQLLRQAHHYVITEGGKDSPTTYMERIYRINEDLVQEITTHSYDCDPKLFRRVKQKIDHVLREFEDAVDADSSLYDCSDSSEYYATAAEEGLYRMDFSPVTPEGPSARRTAKTGSMDDVEKTYLYGGLGNHPESWYKKVAASLPFPETIRMADWESLRIHWDLANTGDAETTESVTGNAVSCNESRLTHHNNLDQYESGSRFKLPTPSSVIMQKVKEFGTANELRRAVHVFYRGDDSKRKNEDYKYVPRVFLDKLEVGQRLSPVDLVDEVRSAVNRTPTKFSSCSNGGSKIGSAPPATRTLLNTSQRPSPSSPVEEDSCLSPIGDENPVTLEIPARKAPQQQATATTSAIRRQRAKMEESLRSVDSMSSPPAKWETAVATHVVIPNKTRVHPRKTATPVAIVPAYQTIATGKRKRLSVDVVEDQTEGDTCYEAVLSKRRELARESVRPCTPTLPIQGDNVDTPASLPALTPCSSVMSTPPFVKARAAGRKQCKIRTKRDSEQRVPQEKFEEITAGSKSIAAAAESIVRGSTRSDRARKP